MKRSFKATELASFRATVTQRLGLQFDDSKLVELADVLRRRIVETKSPDVASYVCLLSTFLPELRAVVGYLTIPETYFFRIPDHFRVLQEVVLPARVRAQSATRQLNILSAGCASGEEPYTIAMLVQGRVDLAGWQVTIRGVDVNEAAIAKGKKGRYSAWSLREIDLKYKERCFRPTGRDFQLDDSIRAKVSLEEGNLADPQAPFWKPGGYDVIFFRNAFMYLSPEAGRAVVTRVAESLAPGGYLFMGPAETLRGVSDAFHLRHTHGTFYYQLRSARGGSTFSHSLLPAMGAGNRAIAQVEKPAAETKVGWSDAIRQATERIRMLTQTPERSQNAAAAAMAATEKRKSVDLTNALELLQEERFEQALTALSSLPAEAQTSPDVQVLRAVLLANRGELAEAEEACNAVLQFDEMNADAYYVKALCSEHGGDRLTAMEMDRTAIFLDPSFAMPYLHIGLLSKRGGEMELAKQELSQASLLLPREDASRILLFGGGFSREALIELCRRESRGSARLA